MVGLPTSTDAADWLDADPAAPVSGFDMGGGPPGAEAQQDLSPEDAAWVDSCLVKDGVNGPAGGEGRSESQSDIDAWATLTEAFIDALAYSAAGNASTAATEEEGGKKKKKVEESSAHVNGGGEASRVDASGDELMTYEAEHAVTGEQASSPTASAYAATFYEQASPTLDDSFSGEGPSAVADQFEEGTAEGNTGSDGGLAAAAAAVIGNEYREDQQEGYADGEDEFSILAGEEVGEVELTRDIFRVWELDVSEEDGDEDGDEAEFGRQLKRALDGTSAGAAGAAGMPLPADNDSGPAMLDAEEWRTSAVALDDENLGELIAGISDISLGRPSSSD